MKIKDKLKSIYDGYKNLIITDKLLEPLFESRYNICKSCENNIAGICELCGCVCKAKSHSRFEDCPDNKWLPVIKIDEDGIYVSKSEVPNELQDLFVGDNIEIDIWKEFLEKDGKEED